MKESTSETSLSQRKGETGGGWNRIGNRWADSGKQLPNEMDEGQEFHQLTPDESEFSEYHIAIKSKKESEGQR